MKLCREGGWDYRYYEFVGMEGVKDGDCKLTSMYNYVI
jgi:hypothetical protein